MSSDTVSDLSKRLQRFAQQLSPNERDALKYRLSVASVQQLEKDFEISQTPEKRQHFFDFLRYILALQPFCGRVPIYGIAYRGRPNFMTDKLVEDLRSEALSFRPYARLNFEQFLATIDTSDDSSFCERLAASENLYHLVTQHAGPCLRSYISSYIYYEIPGQCSKPHVDNAFTAITVMIGLRSDHENLTSSSSASVIYWPDSPPMEYRLEPGELVIFFGTCALHGRYPISSGETIHSLLLSFRPEIVAEVN
jgi:hypothetical protein